MSSNQKPATEYRPTDHRIPITGLPLYIDTISQPPSTVELHINHRIYYLPLSTARGMARMWGGKIITNAA
jgi:hypothetical protein